MMRRRTLLARMGATAALTTGLFGASQADDETFAIMRTENEWRRLLTPEQFAVLRGENTERAGTSPLNDKHRPGVHGCAGCDQPLFDAAQKSESHTGWPSFSDVLPGAVGTRRDASLFPGVRTEAHCSRCGGHLGHVFDDGPPPTGLHCCMNGVAPTFRSEAAAS